MNWTWLFVAAVYAAAVALARRAGAELPRRIALLFYLLVLLFLFQPLTQRAVNFHPDVLSSLPPWYHLTSDHHARNPELNDVPLQLVPWMHQVRESWKSLAPPLWNHHSAGGYPLLGNGQSSAFSLLRIVTLPLWLGHAVTAEAAMKLLIALTFTFLYCRRRYSLLGSTIAAVTFAFNAFVISWLHFPMITAACLAPAVLYAIDLLAEKLTYGRFLFAALVWTQLLFAGHPETAAHLFWLGTVYVLWLVLAEKQSWRLFLTLGGALTVSALLAAPYLGPLLETLPKSKRVAELKELPYSAAAQQHQDRASAIAMFAPRALKATKTEQAGSPGVFGWIAWVASALSVIVSRRWRSRETFYAVATLFVVGVIFAWPLIGDAFHRMMPIAAHGRARLLFTLLCAIQTAAAIDLARRVPMLLAALAAGALLIALPNALLPGIVTVIAAATFALMRPQRRRSAPALLLLVIIAELFASNRDLNPPLPQRAFYPKTPLIAKLQELASTSRQPYRVTGMGAQLFPNLSAIYGFEDIRAHDPMANARYLGFLKLTADYDPWSYFAFLKDPDKPVFDFLNVLYVIADPGAAVPDRYAVIYDGRDGKILENRTVLPRFYGVRNVVPIDYARMREHRDWANTAFADVQVRGAATASIVSARPTDYRLRVTATDRALVVSSIPHWPGWNVTIDGARVKPIEVNAVFLGMVVPKGESDVRVWYAPLSFWMGLCAAAATLIGICGSAVLARRYRRAPAHSTAPRAAW